MRFIREMGFDPAILVRIAAIVVVSALVHLVISRAFDFRLRRAMSSERRTGIKFLRNGIKAGLIFIATIAIIYGIPPLRDLAVGIFAGAGILAAIIGFASQRAMSNIVSGVFIVLFKPFRVDDIVKIRGEIGTIEDITLRHTVIRALENKRIIYPNAVIDSEPIINWTIEDERVQKFMFVSVDFRADLARAAEIICEEAAAHPDLVDGRTPEELAAGKPLVEVPVLDLQQSMVNFRVPLWARDLPTAMRMTWDLHASIARRFEAEGIPFGRPSQLNFSGDALGDRPA